MGATRLDEYKPTASQRCLLQAFIDAPDASNITALCAVAGVSTQTYYVMRWNDDAWDWWLRETARAAERERPTIYAALIRMARGGDVQAITRFLERFDPDYAPRSRRETSGRLLIEAKERRKLPDWQQHALEVEGQGQLSAPADGDPVPSAEVPEPQETPVEGGATPQECSELRENTPTGADSAQETAVEGEAGEG